MEEEVGFLDVYDFASRILAGVEWFLEVRRLPSKLVAIEMLDERSMQHRCSMFSYFRSIPGVFRADDFNSPSIGSR